MAWQVMVSDAQRAQLEWMVRADPLPYTRERAAALLKVAAGAYAKQVARTGLLRPRDPDTVYGWIARVQAEGVAGLTIKPGRGRKPAFSPSAPDGRADGARAHHPARSASVR